MTRLIFPTPLRVAVLISGGGTTLKNLLRHTEIWHKEKGHAEEGHARQDSLPIEIGLVISSNSNAAGLSIAEAAGVATQVCERGRFYSPEEYSIDIFDRCRAAGARLVVMAGFLKFVPIPNDFTARVINIHPALIPAFCGQGMYGHRVHQAALAYGVKVSGCTVHFVDNQYDHGPILLQRAVPVLDDDTPDSLAARVFEAECEAYPAALRLLAAGRVSLIDRRVTIDG